MQFAPVNSPLIGCIHDGVVIPVRQRPVDGHFPVGPEFHDQQPSRNGQQHRSTGPVHGVPALPGGQQPIAMFHGLASIGPGPAQAASYGNVHPGGPCHHAPSPGQPMLSFDQMMLRCSMMMDLLVQQQQHLQQALSTMAAAPFSSLRTMCGVPQLHKSEVTVAAHCSLAPCQPARSTTPQSSVKMCPMSSVSTENDRSHLRAHTIDTSTSLASPTESCEAHLHGPMCARNCADSEQGVHQDGGKASQQIQQGRKCNYSTEPKRQQCDVEPLEAQVWLEHSVGSGTSDVNRKQLGCPAAACASATSDPTQRLPGESSCDVNVGSTQHQGIVLASKEPAKRPGCDGVDDDGRCRIAESSASAAQWTTVSAANQKDQQCAVSCAIDAVVLDWWKQISTLVPVDRSVRAPFVVVARILFVNINTGLPTSRILILSQHEHTHPQAKCVDTADDCSQQFIEQRRRWLEPGEVEAFVNQPPPWPPPAAIIVDLLAVEPMPDPSPNSTCSSTQETSPLSSISKFFRMPPSMINAD